MMLTLWWDLRTRSRWIFNKMQPRRTSGVERLTVWQTNHLRIVLAPQKKVAKLP